MMRHKFGILSVAFAVILCFCSCNSATVFNVRDFGAKGDGVSIDSPAINMAIEAAAKVGGGTVYFPAGVYSSYSIYFYNRLLQILFLNYHVIIYINSI